MASKMNQKYYLVAEGPKNEYRIVGPNGNSEKLYSPLNAADFAEYAEVAYKDGYRAAWFVSDMAAIKALEALRYFIQRGKYEQVLLAIEIAIKNRVRGTDDAL